MSSLAEIYRRTQENNEKIKRGIEHGYTSPHKAAMKTPETILGRMPLSSGENSSWTAPTLQDHHPSSPF
jgi:hypothetical protein